MVRNPAKVQVDPATVNSEVKPAQTGQIFNLWYSRWTGGEGNGRGTLIHRNSRCHPIEDTGYTKADKDTPDDSINRDKYICLYFARGTCCNGERCDYLHRLPGDLDVWPPTVDCFGREKFADYRDDMTGVGSFNHVNRTLFVGRINEVDCDLEMALSKRFGEYGDVERVRLVKGKRIAFVTYRLESQAQFAKESMYCQSVKDDDKEALDIRWATEDPNPTVRKRQREEDDRRALEQAEKLLMKMKEQAAEEEEKEEEQEEEQEEGQGELGGEDHLLSDKPFFNSGIDLSVFAQLKRKRAKMEPAVAQSGLSSNGLALDYDSDSD